MKGERGRFKGDRGRKGGDAGGGALEFGIWGRKERREESEGERRRESSRKRVK